MWRSSRAFNLCYFLVVAGLFVVAALCFAAVS